MLFQVLYTLDFKFSTVRNDVYIIFVYIISTLKDDTQKIY